MKLDNKHLILFTLLIIPAFGFGLLLGQETTIDGCVITYNTKLIIMFVCITISSVSFGVLLSRIFK